MNDQRGGREAEAEVFSGLAGNMAMWVSRGQVAGLFQVILGPNALAVPSGSNKPPLKTLRT